MTSRGWFVFFDNLTRWRFQERLGIVQRSMFDNVVLGLVLVCLSALVFVVWRAFSPPSPVPTTQVGTEQRPAENAGPTATELALPMRTATRAIWKHTPDHKVGKVMVENGETLTVKETTRGLMVHDRGGEVVAAPLTGKPPHFLKEEEVRELQKRSTK